MAPSFSKNAILMGAVDHFCLACESHLKCEEDVLAHISKPVHKKSLNSTQYADTLEKDHIRKIKKRYFCEFCNFLMNTLAKARVHVNGEKHGENKRNVSLYRKGATMVGFDDIVIKEQAWNGMRDNSCAICNAEYEDENIHKTETAHVLNLVQIKVQLDENRNIYRKLDQSVFHCLTCNNVLSLESITSHWTTPEHKNLYEACRDGKPSVNFSIKLSSKSEMVTENYTDIPKNDVTAILNVPIDCTQKTHQLDGKIQNPDVTKTSALHEDVINDRKAKNTKNEEIFDALPRLQESGIRITFETNVAFCTKCSITLSLDMHVLEEHIKRHPIITSKNNTVLKSTSSVVLNNDANVSSITKDERETEVFTKHGNTETNNHKDTATKNNTMLKFSPVDLKIDEKVKPNASTLKTEKEVIEDLARSNNMKFRHNGKSIYCKTCNVIITYSLVSVNNHIKTWAHRKISQKPTTEKAELKKISFDDFIYNVIDTNPLYINSDIILNDMICISYFSFMFYTSISEKKNKLRCQACETNLTISELQHHNNSDKHFVAVHKSSIVKSDDFTSEFIREVRPNIYHCGICNFIILSWENMELHLKSLGHNCEKRKSESRFQELAPMIRQRNLQRHMERQVFGFLLNML